MKGPSDLWIMDSNGIPKQVHDILEWARWYENGDNRRVAKDTVCGIEVSTVFLGLDHNWRNGEPILYETMSFGTGGIGWPENECNRYHTREEALAGHRAMIDAITTRAEERAMRIVIDLTDDEVAEAITDFLLKHGQMCGDDTVSKDFIEGIQGIEVIPPKKVRCDGEWHLGHVLAAGCAKCGEKHVMPDVS